MAEKPLIDPAESTPISLASETRYVPNGIVSRTLLRTPGLRLVLFSFSAGQELTEHTSTSHAVVQVLSGECDFRVRETTHRLRSGDLLSMPANAPHAVRAETDFSMLLTLAPVAVAAPMVAPGLGRLPVSGTVGQ